jgi:hypothetical protein
MSNVKPSMHKLSYALLLAAGVAAASTKVDVTASSAGFTVGMQSLVGRDADKESARVELQKRLDENKKRFAATYRHFATGNHPYTATRKLLDARKTRDGKHASINYEGFTIDLHLAAGATDAASQRAVADFALAQLFPGGDLAKQRGDVCAADNEQHFTRTTLNNFTMVGGNGPVNDLLWANSCKSTIKRFATKPPPDSAYQKVDKEDVAKAAPRTRLVGVAQARALMAFLDRKPYSAADLAALAAIEASEDVERVARNMVLLLPASRRDWITKELLPHLTKAQPKLADGVFGKWLAEMAKL